MLSTSLAANETHHIFCRHGGLVQSSCCCTAFGMRTQVEPARPSWFPSKGFSIQTNGRSRSGGVKTVNTLAGVGKLFVPPFGCLPSPVARTGSTLQRHHFTPNKGALTPRLLAFSRPRLRPSKVLLVPPNVWPRLAGQRARLLVISTHARTQRLHASKHARRQHKSNDPNTLTHRSRLTR